MSVQSAKMQILARSFNKWWGSVWKLKYEIKDKQRDFKKQCNIKVQNSWEINNYFEFRYQLYFGHAIMGTFNTQTE